MLKIIVECEIINSVSVFYLPLWEFSSKQEQFAKSVLVLTQLWHKKSHIFFQQHAKCCNVFPFRWNCGEGTGEGEPASHQQFSCLTGRAEHEVQAAHICTHTHTQIHTFELCKVICSHIRRALDDTLFHLHTAWHTHTHTQSDTYKWAHRQQHTCAGRQNTLTHTHTHSDMAAGCVM